VVITGEMDDIAPSGKIKGLMPIWNPDAHFNVIKGADHFYSSRTEDLKNVLIQLI
jgi:hypothetical protein